MRGCIILIRGVYNELPGQERKMMNDHRVEIRTGEGKTSPRESENSAERLQEAANAVLELLKDINLPQLHQELTRLPSFLEKTSNPTRTELYEKFPTVALWWKAREDYLREHPHFPWEIELFFGLPLFLWETYERKREEEKADTPYTPPRGEVSRRARKKAPPLEWKRISQALTSLTEYLNLVTHVVIQNTDNPSYLEGMWGCADKIAKAIHLPNGANCYKIFKRCQSGILGQAVAFLALRELGQSPRLSTPKEDVQRRTDMIAYVPGHEVPVPTQVKTSRGIESVAVRVIPGEFYPFVGPDENGNDRIYDPPPDALFAPGMVEIFLPYDSFNRITGKPTEETIRQIREQLTAEVNALANPTWRK